MGRLLDKSADGKTDALSLRGILQTCGLDVDSVVDSVLHNGHARGDATLSEIAERLKRATGMLDRMMGCSAAEAPVPAVALMLVREADHRISGSLQTLISILDQQASRAEAETIRNVLRAASARVAAIAAVHALLHTDANQYEIAPELNLRTYLHRLCAVLRGSLDIDGEHRVLHADVEQLTISPEAARWLGLIVAELITNALRHAFEPTQSGAVLVYGQYRSDDCYQLCVEDNGKGLPPGFELGQQPCGFGLQMANMLADALPAGLTAGGQAGARFVLSLPVEHRDSGGIGRLVARR